MDVDIRDVKRTRDGHNFHFSTVFEIDKDEAMRVQANMGYHPHGYGFYGFKSSSDGTTWFCYDNCD